MDREFFPYSHREWKLPCTRVRSWEAGGKEGFWREEKTILTGSLTLKFRDCFQQQETGLPLVGKLKSLRLHTLLKQ